MPWDARSFSEKHNHSLHGEKAGHAARIANAILKRSGDEGMAIATANKWAGKHASGGSLGFSGAPPGTDINQGVLGHGPRISGLPPGTDINRALLEMKYGAGGEGRFPLPPPAQRAGGGIVGYDGGGQVDPNAGGGIGGPTPVQGANPLTQNMIQRYAAYPTEKLAELAAQMGGTPQGQLIQRLLMQRRMTPTPQAPQQQQGIVAPQVGSYARGGTVKRDMGGGMGVPSGILNEEERINARQDSGFLHGATPGRADQVQTTAPPGSHVLPADVIAGLGQGNSLSGARIMQGILNSGPYGTPLPRMRGRSTIPRPPPPLRDFKSGGTIPIFSAEGRAGGGANRGNTPVDLSDGEFVVGVNDVIRFGYGDKERGHKFFDDFIVRKRKQHIEQLKNLRGPVKP